MIVSKPLYVALAQRKEDRRARLQVGLSHVLIVIGCHGSKIRKF